jgi:hypothetical protein
MAATVPSSAPPRLETTGTGRNASSWTSRRNRRSAGILLC